MPYALIGGVAVQIWAAEPRTTLDIDIAVKSYDDLPRAEMKRAGFVRGRRFEHTENWTGPDATPVLFSDDPAFSAAIAEASAHPVGTTRLRVAPVLELVRSKLRAARDDSRRRSKRLRDFADSVALIEAHPKVRSGLGAADRRQVERDADESQ